MVQDAAAFAAHNPFATLLDLLPLLNRRQGDVPCGAGRGCICCRGRAA